MKNEQQAAEYIDKNLRYNLCYNELLAVKLAYEYGKSGNIDRLKQLEMIIDATKTPAEIRTASYKLGSRFIKSIRQMNVKMGNRLYFDYIQTSPESKKHYTVIYGLFCACMGISYIDMTETFIYAQTSAMVTNCVKIVPLSQSAGQKILYQCHPVFSDVLEQLGILTIEDYGLSTPGFDIRCMQHEALYSRIYMS